MMTRARRIFAACLAAACVVLGLRTLAFAQSSESTGIIQITVKSADSQASLSNARVFLLGPSVASALTTRSGIVKYTDVASGIYRVRVNKPGYRNSTSAAFELLGVGRRDGDRERRPQERRTARGLQIGEQVARVLRALVGAVGDAQDDAASTGQVSDLSWPVGTEAERAHH